MQNLTCISSDGIVNLIIQYWYYINLLFCIVSNGTCHVVFTPKRAFYYLLLISCFCQIVLIYKPLLLVSKFWVKHEPQHWKYKMWIMLGTLQNGKSKKRYEFSSSLLNRQKIFFHQYIYIIHKLLKTNWYFQIMEFRQVRYYWAQCCVAEFWV